MTLTQSVQFSPHTISTVCFRRTSSRLITLYALKKAMWLVNSCNGVDPLGLEIYQQIVPAPAATEDI